MTASNWNSNSTFKLFDYYYFVRFQHATHHQPVLSGVTYHSPDLIYIVVPPDSETLTSNCSSSPVDLFMKETKGLMMSSFLVRHVPIACTRS